MSCFVYLAKIDQKLARLGYVSPLFEIILMSYTHIKSVHWLKLGTNLLRVIYVSYGASYNESSIHTTVKRAVFIWVSKSN